MCSKKHTTKRETFTHPPRADAGEEELAERKLKSEIEGTQQPLYFLSCLALQVRKALAGAEGSVSIALERLTKDTL